MLARSAPTALPTIAAPTAIAQRLPAPLYFQNDQRQIVRLEVDGVSWRVITREPEGVEWLAVAPRSGVLAYVVAMDSRAARRP